jgi:thiamine-triphosphatase
MDESGKDLEGLLQKVAEFKTEREEWDIEGFRVVLDEADFGWCVGEVELCREVLGGDEESAREKGTEMDRQIERFMAECGWAFPEGKVEGKLLAYFRWKKEGGVGAGV